MVCLIPYYPQPSFQLGPLTLHMFGILVACGILLGAWVLGRRLRWHGVDAELVGDYVLWIMIAGFVGAHLADVLLYRPQALAADPLLLLRIWDGISSYGGFLAALLAAVLYVRRRLPDRRTRWIWLDQTAYALPFGWVFGRLGCFSAHDHPGVPSQFWLAVDFPPDYFGPGRGGPHLDLGLLEALFAAGICALLLVLGRRRRPVGFYLVLLPLLYAPVRFGLDFLRLPEVDARYFGLTPAQYLSILVAGLALFALRVRPREVAPEPPEPGAVARPAH
ncbi:MAG: prolipoprotein diacylglyceryl transferase [Planctomycetota bacterium]|nr:MAG: prolipoprotein diacylglyceryl transferase [Planctomycetota bacterium]